MRSGRKSSQSRRSTAHALCVLILLLTWGGALHFAQWMTAEYNGISARIQGSAIKHDAFAGAVAASTDTNITGAAAWSRGEHPVQAQNPVTGASHRARGVAVFGNMRAVCPATLLFGNYPVTEDRFGCMIDERVALALYGNADVAGAPLILSGKRYTVRGVMRSKESMVLIRDDSATYTNLEFDCADLARAEASATAFLLRCAPGSDYILVKTGLYGNMIAPLCGLPGWIVIAWLTAPLLKAVWQRRMIPLQLAVLTAGCAVLFLVLPRLLNLRAYWPDCFLPAQWSDFSFWRETFTSESANFDAIAFLLPLPKDMLWFAAMRKCRALLFAACLASVAVIRMGNGLSNRYIERFSLACIVAFSVAAISLLRLLGWEFLPTTGYLSALPLWYLTQNLRKNLWRIKFYGLRIAKKYQ